jgi:hypothetical protein
MFKVSNRKNYILKLFSIIKYADDDDVYSGEDIYDYSSFIKENFYDPDASPDLKIEIQDSDPEIVEEFDLVMERMEILIEKRFDSDDENLQPHDFMDLFRKELQDMVSKFDSIILELGLGRDSELAILYRMFGQYLDMYDDYEGIVV